MAGAEPVALPDGVTPGKVIAVHLNYHSRAAQRGRVPTEPSYFLKPPSSLSAGGDVVRPRGTELLAFEGEIAVIIGARARNVSPEEAGRTSAGTRRPTTSGCTTSAGPTAAPTCWPRARTASRRSARRMAAEGVDPTTLHITTHRQRRGAPGRDRRRPDLHLRQLVADLSRFMTLEPGDVILTGTPAGANVVGPGDVVEVKLDGAGTVTSTIVEAGAELGSVRRDAEGHRRGARVCHRRHHRPATARGAERRRRRRAAAGLDRDADGAARPAAGSRPRS